MKKSMLYFLLSVVSAVLTAQETNYITQNDIPYYSEEISPCSRRFGIGGIARKCMVFSKTVKQFAPQQFVIGLYAPPAVARELKTRSVFFNGDGAIHCFDNRYRYHTSDTLLFVS